MQNDHYISSRCEDSIHSRAKTREAFPASTFDTYLTAQSLPATKNQPIAEALLAMPVAPLAATNYPRTLC